MGGVTYGYANGRCACSLVWASHTIIGNAFFLAHKLACPIYFHYALSEGMTQRLHFSRFALHQTDDLSRNIAQDAQQLADMMQQAITAHPEQWIWLYRRFK